MKKYFPFYVLIVMLWGASCSPDKHDAISTDELIVWPDSVPWWKANNLRVIQTNLPAYEAGLNVDSLVADLTHFSANTLIINAGGIMAFYPTKLDFHYINPYMKENMLRDVVTKCHAVGIRVIVRFDFSRAHRSIFGKHPDWFYISPAGERIMNDDMVVVSINAPYEQQHLFSIVEEVIDNYPVDGIFINMPGYQIKDSYTGKYHGIDQNIHDKKRFAEYSDGMTLPVKEDINDPVFQKYQEFKKYTADEIVERLNALVKSKSKQIAVCTYSEKHVDIIRHESQTNTLPYWPYNASDNVNNASHSYPDHIISNASIQQISFQSRYNAVEPEEVAIRLYENIANGSGLDLSLMGDFQEYEDERNYDVIRRIYAHHKRHEAYFGRYTSPAQVAVIAPGSWPSGEAGQEYRGIQLMLKEAHIQYDIIENSQVGNLAHQLKKYKLVILPEITRLDTKSLEALITACNQGTNLIATNKSLTDHPEVMMRLFGAKVVNNNHDGAGFYLQNEGNSLFKRLTKQRLISWKFNLGLYDFSASDTSLLPILTPGRPGPPEIIGGHEPSGYFFAGVKQHATSKAVLLTGNIGKLYHLHGYEQYKNIVLDIIDYIAPAVKDLVHTDAHERVEVILQRFKKNLPAAMNKSTDDGMILHLVNMTGFSGNSYFSPLPVMSTEYKVRCTQKPAKVFSLVNNKVLNSTWDGNYIRFTIDRLEEFESIVMQYEND